MIGLTVHRTATASFTAEQWGLSASDDRDVAVEMLNAALTEALNSPGADPAFVYDSMAAVQAQFGDIGADDSQAAALINRAVFTFMGRD